MICHDQRLMDTKLIDFLEFVPLAPQRTDGGTQGKREPTPREIAEATAAIRATWSEAEHRRRAGLDPHELWEVTEASFPYDICLPPKVRP